MRTPTKTVRPRSRTAGLAISGLLAAGLLWAGCGGSDDSGVAVAGGGSTATSPTTTTASVDRETALINFSKCMRTDGGVPDFPDPQPDANGELQLPRGGQANDPAALQDGFEKCSQHIEGVLNTSPEAQSDIADAQLAVAKCMREEGVDIADPDPNQVGPGAFGDVDFSDPDVQAALEKCRPLFEEALENVQGGS